MVDTKQKAWRGMSNDELKEAVTNIIRSSSTADEVNAKAKEELGYEYTIAVTWDSTGRMFMAMFWSKEGTIISI